ncbi:MAG: hypothetical protein EBZ48_03905 [Proteobacteria bacterium]|nr:hypothetical protein [Pseudomonadota bacterium]
MPGTLSERYLLYLRDMSRKVSFGSTSVDFSQVLIKPSRKKTNNKFHRVTDLRLSQVLANGADGYRRQLDQEKIGQGIFCGAGILAGTYVKKLGSSNTLKLIAAPTIYSQVIFEENGDAGVSEWVLNYDVATALIARNTDEEEEAYAAFDPEAGKTGTQIVQEIEDALDDASTNDLDRVNQLSNRFVDNLKDFTETECEVIDRPLACIEAGIEARDSLRRKQFYYCPGDWIFFAPIPPGLSTYRALDELANEKGGN